MNSLPDTDNQPSAKSQSSSTDDSSNSNQYKNTAAGANISIDREREIGIGMDYETAKLSEVGREKELSKELSDAGVVACPTTTPELQNLTAHGVRPSGHSVTLGNGALVTLPLTDDQISQGLSQDITSSWRWLAHWCIRKLKSLHIAFKVIHGKIIRVNK